MSKPPPPRYKIVERGGRLVTIDTWAAKGAPPAASPGVRTPDPWRGPPRGEAAGPGAKLVAAVLRVQDADGRRLLTTAPAWDRKGPRTIALSAAGERRLGAVLLAAAVVLVVLAAFAIVDLDWLLPMAIIGAVLSGSLATSGAPLLTRFLDSLGEDVPG